MAMEYPYAGVITVFRDLPHLYFSFSSGIRDVNFVSRVFRERRSATVGVSKVLYVGLVHGDGRTGVVDVRVLFSVVAYIGEVSPWSKGVLGGRAIGITYFGVE